LLAGKMRAAGLTDYAITNLSLSGGTTLDGLRMLPKGLNEPVDIFILELGINDIFRGHSLDEITANLQEIIDQVKAKNPAVRLVILGWQIPNHEKDDGFVGEFGKMYADLAAKNNAAYLPYVLKGVSGKPLLNSGDGIHPNVFGQKILAKNVWEVLEPVAREVSAMGNVGGASVPRPTKESGH
jgi:acyl-CoA thioesterase-1